MHDNRDKNGQWIIKNGLLFCSLCKEEPTGEEITDYCDHCGAKMLANDTIMWGGMSRLIVKATYGM